LPEPGRPDHQQIVTTRGGDLDGALRRLLALDVAEIGITAVVVAEFRLRWGEDLGALEVIDQCQQRSRRQHLDAGGPRGLAALQPGADQAETARRSVNRRRQHARDGGERAVERQFAQRGVAGDLVARQHVHGGEQTERDRQVEVAALLEQIGRRQVDGDSPRRQRQAHRRQRRAHPLPALGHRLVGQAHDRKRRQALGDLHLDVHVENVDALERHRVDARHHADGCTSPGLGKA
jgi:hypothetical protein